MPNYVNNRLEIHAPNKERLKEILDSIKSVDEEAGMAFPMDFNSIDPMPSGCLDIDFIMAEFTAARYLIKDILYPVSERWAKEEWDSLTEDQKERSLQGARKMIENILKYGHPTYCDWARAHWGTKWNALEPKLEGANVVCFQTAWSDPNEVLKTLSRKFPDTSFKNTYADENCGYNCGVVRYMNGKEYRHEPDKGSIPAYELSFTLWPDREELFVLTGNGYEPIEE